jgi:hypothetical protein
LTAGKGLVQQKRAILDRWIELVLETYPPETAPLLKGGDRFRNPVGYTIATELGTIFDELLNGMDETRLHGAVENVVKMRAVQGFTSAEAAGFAGYLEVAVKERGGSIPQSEVLELERRIEIVNELGTECDARCRAKILEISRREAEVGGIFVPVRRARGDR